MNHIDHEAELYALGMLDDDERARFSAFAAPILRNWNGIEVGALRAAGPRA